MLEELTKLLLAVGLGGLIGAERQLRDKAAGFRTIILICAGSTLFTIISNRVAGQTGDPGRISANIVTGVGFLGAGVILRHRGQVLGLTTASAVWFSAALGMAIGAGFYLLSAVAAAAVVAVLWIFPIFERWMGKAHETCTYEVTLAPEGLGSLTAAVKESGLRLFSLRQAKRKEQMVCTVVASGSIAGHKRLAARLFDDSGVEAFTTG